MDAVKKSDIEEIRTLNSPPPLVKTSLEAMFLLLGYPAAQVSVSMIQS
jgi:hypothetical protein